MKPINIFISEKLKITKPKEKVKHTLFPKTKDELKEMIEKEIDQNGYECDLNHIDVSKITDLNKIFWHTETLHFNGDISKWDVSNVKNMSCMFLDSTFNGDISEWDVSNVENMERMFEYSYFNGDISEWNISNVKRMNYMFAYSKFNEDISRWDVSNVENMHSMFYHSTFNKNISNWDINSKCITYNMFIDCPIEYKYKPSKDGKKL